MSGPEIQEQGASPSDTSLYGQHGSWTTTPRLCATSEPNAVSMRSAGRLLDFKVGQVANGRFQQTQQRPDSPEFYGVSMRSNTSVRRLIDFKDSQVSADGLLQEQRQDTPDLRYVSMRSDSSAGRLLDFKDGQHGDGWRMQKDQFVTDNITCNEEQPAGQRLQQQSPEVLRSLLTECQQKLKHTLRMKFQCIFDVIAKAGNPTLLNQIYTELYITEGGMVGINEEHEVRQIEAASRKFTRPETTIRKEDIFKPPPGRNGPIRTTLTKGVAGIGKTVLTQKFTLDWAEDKANQDMDFTFPFAFRELNMLKDKNFSLVELLHHFFSQTKDAGFVSFEDLQVVFIFDGLDECRLPLDFHNNETLTDVTESTSVDVLLTNLIRGNLLPSAHLWITTRPAAANLIPPECVDMVTEVRGFTDPQKEEYFRKRFRDDEQARRIIAHIKSSRSLYIMCHIPVFCWISATVLDDMLRTREEGDLPKTLTEMYIHFLVLQTKLHNVKYDGGADSDLLWNSKTSGMIESLGKLAFEQLQKGNLIFYQSDLTECSIDIRRASVCSGVFTQIFREERGLYQDKVFCFVHLSLQEFLAALHVHLVFVDTGVNLLAGERTVSRQRPKLKHLYESAVEEALRSPNGHLDLFLRFLLGLSLQKNQSHLRGLLKETEKSSETNQIVKFIKKKMKGKLSPERSINLFHCLNELNDHSLVEEIQQQMRSGHLCTDALSPAQWSALVFVLLSSQEDLDVFDLRKYAASEKALLRLLQVVKASNKAVLSNCKLSTRSFEALSSVVRSPSSSLRELDLSNNELQDSGVALLCAGIDDPHCLLQTLRLSSCNLLEKSCFSLSAALSCQPSSLRELDLSHNKLKDSGVQLLSTGLVSPQCKLKTLRLTFCNLSEGSCSSLASVLSHQFSSLRELDLNDNDVQDSGVKLLSIGLRSQHCKLETLSQLTQQDKGDMIEFKTNVGAELVHVLLRQLHQLSGCCISEEGCASLALALSSNPLHLRELDLSYNHPGDSAVKLLTAKLDDPLVGLATLRVDHAALQRLKPGLMKYSCELEVDTTTINRKLKLSDDKRKVTFVRDNEMYPDHADRFDHLPQLLCTTKLTGRCYWEVECKGVLHLSVSYSGIGRKGKGEDCVFGRNRNSWSLTCFHGGFSVCHDKSQTPIPACRGSNRAAVFLDHPAGTLSFYSVSSTDNLTHLHTFNTNFSQPLYAGCGVWSGSASLQQGQANWEDTG